MMSLDLAPFSPFPPQPLFVRNEPFFQSSSIFWAVHPRSERAGGFSLLPSGHETTANAAVADILAFRRAASTFRMASELREAGIVEALVVVRFQSTKLIGEGAFRHKKII